MRQKWHSVNLAANANLQIRKSAPIRATIVAKAVALVLDDVAPPLALGERI